MIEGKKINVPIIVLIKKKNSRDKKEHLIKERRMGNLRLFNAVSNFSNFLS